MKIESKIQSLNRRTDQEEVDRQLREVSSSYEKHFLREMVKAMRSSVPDAGLIQKNMAEKIFSEKLDEEYVEAWGDKGGIGLAEVIYSDIKAKIFGDVGVAEEELPKVFMPLGDSEDSVSPHPVKMKELDNGFEVQWESPPVGDGVGKVKAPLKGVVVGHVESRGWHSLRLDHGPGGHSLLSFPGGLSGGLAPGASLEPGVEVGRLDPDGGRVHWRWFKKSV